jgi:hypothetical protein
MIESSPDFQGKLYFLENKNIGAVMGFMGKTEDRERKIGLIRIPLGFQANLRDRRHS